MQSHVEQKILHNYYVRLPHLVPLKNPVADQPLIDIGLFLREGLRPSLRKGLMSPHLTLFFLIPSNNSSFIFCLGFSIFLCILYRHRYEILINLKLCVAKNPKTERKKKRREKYMCGGNRRFPVLQRLAPHIYFSEKSRRSEFLKKICGVRRGELY